MTVVEHVHLKLVANTMYPYINEIFGNYIYKMSVFNITFSDSITNKLPKNREINTEQLEKLSKTIPYCELYRLDYNDDHDPASVLIIRNGLELMGVDESISADVLREKLNNLIGKNIMYGIDVIDKKFQSTYNNKWYGETDKRKVITVRFGCSMNLSFQWYKYNHHDDTTTVYKINPGDIYIMSDKANGNDWYNSDIWTLRHSIDS